MTLVEKLGERDGEVGEYKWKVEIWRSDTDALANLRLRKRVYRVHERTWWPSDRWERVYSDISVASDGSLDSKLPDAVEYMKEKCERFESENHSVAETLEQ